MIYCCICLLKILIISMFSKYQVILVRNVDLALDFLHQILQRSCNLRLKTSFIPINKLWPSTRLKDSQPIMKSLD